MKRIRLLSIALGSAALLGASAVWAATETGWFTIETMVIGTSMDGAYRVYPAGGVAENPAGCSNTDYYQIASSGITQAEKDVMTRTLLSAHLAGKKTRLWLQATSGACANTRPAYYGVIVDNSH